jgi:putative tryptophan/tyrosine transport system substrate-binding protein
MRRREFITGLGSAAAWPAAARAQQGDRVRRIAVLMSFDENDPVTKPRLSAFRQALADLGWTDGRNIRMDLRWDGGDINRIRALAQELVGVQPDVILVTLTAATVALQRETRTIPIVFVTAGDPVASGIVIRLNQPGENIAGFANYEGSLGGGSPLDVSAIRYLVNKSIPGKLQPTNIARPDRRGCHQAQPRRACVDRGRRRRGATRLRVRF